MARRYRLLRGTHTAPDGSQYGKGDVIEDPSDHELENNLAGRVEPLEVQTVEEIEIGVHATATAMGLAEEHGIDILDEVYPGTGEEGRVLKADVQDVIDHQETMDAPDPEDDEGYGPLDEEEELDIDATDEARDLAVEHGIDLREVEGTGHEGRITVADVRGEIDEEE